LRPFTGNGARRRRAGFTLVEVIVVLVILAILAAIAIPALTGYIDKAEDKQYIAMARDIALAHRAVIDEAYATGELFTWVVDEDYIKTGEPRNGFKVWTDGSGGNTVKVRMMDLISKKRSIDGWTPDYAQIYVLGAKTDASTLLNADGFQFFYFPLGQHGSGAHPLTIVTYKVAYIDPSGKTSAQWNTDFNDNGVYDADAGYYVYDWPNE
jgi:prepilin-type N-terminal cleavage/methylation domain-containing protein